MTAYMHYLPWIVLAVSLLVLAYACRVLIEDVKGGFDVTMGGANLFSTTWLLGAVGAATGLAQLPGIAWGWGVAVFVAIYALKGAAYCIITALYLGADAPPPAKDGFREFMRKTGRKDGA